MRNSLRGGGGHKTVNLDGIISIVKILNLLIILFKLFAQGVALLVALIFPF